jgi:hypothetical protein
MPVIRGEMRGAKIPDAERNAMLQKLKSELAGIESAGGRPVWDLPLFFEIPLQRLDGSSDRIDVIVVWNSFQPIPFEDRAMLILEAYEDRASRIAQTIGVTCDEAMEQTLLPYRIMHHEQPGAVTASEISQAMLAEGGFEYGGRVELLLPTRQMAEKVQARLYERLPKGAWYIGEIVRYD